MALLFHSMVKRDDWWRKELGKHLPDLEIRFWPEIGDPDEIEFALCYNLPHGELAKLKNLKAVFSLGAGVDHLINDPDFPKHIPFARVVDDELTSRMCEYVVQHVLNHHRYQHQYDAQQKEKTWKENHAPAVRDRKVGILGLGALGQGAASVLSMLNFDVAGWSRSAKNLDEISTFHGDDQLDEFLARTEILVCLLPLTPQTTGIMNKNLFDKLPKDAAIINPGRGQHLIENDLISALDAGHLSAATLDVFAKEPLPQDNPLWSHPKIRITPHVASIANPSRVAALIAQNIVRARNGETLANQVDITKGY